METWENAITPAAAGEQTTNTDTTEVVQETESVVEAPSEVQSEQSEPVLEVQATDEDETSEQATDEDVQEGDPAEVLALPSGSAARRWARHQFHEAEPIRNYLDYSRPISTVADDLFNRSQSRYGELAKDIITNHPDFASQVLFGMDVKDAKARLETQPPATPEQPQTSTGLFTEEELNNLPWEVPERLQKFEEEQRRKEAELKTQNEELQKRLEALEGKTSTWEQQEQQRVAEARQLESQKIGWDLYDSAWSVVEQGIKDTGLEINKNDSPELRNLKEAAIDLLSKERVEKVFDEDAENRKLVESIMEAVNRGERKVAFRQEDNLKVRARAAFEKAKSSGKVQSILRQIESLGSKPQARDIPTVPVPGASAGVSVKPPKTWDDAISMST